MQQELTNHGQCSRRTLGLPNLLRENQKVLLGRCGDYPPQNQSTALQARPLR